jgi:PKD repeat protein
MRVTRLDACGRPVYGDGNQVVSDGFVTATLSAEVQEGDAITVTKANGQTCINEPGEDQLQWYSTEIEFCQVDPDLVQIMNQSWDKVLDAEGNVIGYNANGSLSGDGFALEIWMDTYGTSDACSGEAAQGSWGYILLPWVKGGAPGDIEIGNDAISFTFNGRTKVGSRWRRGPYAVQTQANGAPGPLLQPIGDNTHYRLFETTIRPPEPECGAQPVDRPTPEVAELFITGVPGESPRRTVRLRADNHGFGPVVINWGDATAETTASDGQYVTHTYAADGNYTITVRDQQTPAVTLSKDIVIPLPADDPVLTLTADDPDDRYTVTATVALPEQASGEATVDWGDGTDPEEVTVGGDGTVDVTHTYKAAGVYTVTVRRADVDTYRVRAAVAVPVQDDPTASAVEDTADATGMTADLTWDNAPNGPVSINWGDGTVVDQTEAGSVSHAYTTNGAKTVTVTSKANAAASTQVNFTIPFP